MHQYLEAEVGFLGFYKQDPTLNPFGPQENGIMYAFHIIVKMDRELWYQMEKL